MPSETDDVAAGPLAGLVVIDLSTTLPGSQTTQFLSDAGADVILVEPPGGSPLRRDAGWPGLLRGKRSISLDLNDPAGRETLDGLLGLADVLVTTLRPRAADRFGFTEELLAQRFPRLVTAMITGWGRRGPWADRKGYEGLILAETGVLHSKRQLTPGDDPAYVSAPYASFGAAQAAIQGILAALIERSVSGLGQVVEADLVTGVGAYDPYNWFYELVVGRYPDAFEPLSAAFDDQGRPQAYLMYALLAAATKDGAWLQFAQTAPRLMQAWLTELGVTEELKDPKWEGFPMLPTPELRFEWWTKMLAKVQERTLAQWQEVFEHNPNLFAEQFRSADEALEHPQLVHEGRVVTVEDPELGPVRQPSTLVHAHGRPLTDIRRAPRLGEHTEEITRLAESAAPQDDSQINAAAPRYPLAGITVLELGAMYAGPYGATLLTDLGARVIKIEPPEGDLIRTLVAFPEAGGAKVLQGKESIAIDLSTSEGRQVLRELVPLCDAVLQTYRGGVAERMGIDEAALKRIKPDLVYLNAPGYGVDGPYGSKPAYAPSIGAASGVSKTDAPMVDSGPRDEAELLYGARHSYVGGTIPAVQTDGMAALGVGSALLLGLCAKRRGVDLDGMVTTMLGTSTQALIARNTSYAGRPAIPRVDREFRGLSALYRLYRAADGWIFLAAPKEDEWDALVTALGEYGDLRDERFATPQARSEQDAALAAVLETIFSTRPKAAWESLLTSHDVGCAVVAQHTAERRMQSDEFYAAGYAVQAYSPFFEEHRRLAPLNRFSRSESLARGGCMIGEHTDALLSEIGYGPDRIAELRASGIVH